MIVLNDRTRLTDLVHLYGKTPPKAVFFLFAQAVFCATRSKHTRLPSPRYTRLVTPTVLASSCAKNNFQLFLTCRQLTDLVHNMKKPSLKLGFFFVFLAVFCASPPSHSCWLSCRKPHSANALLWAVSLEENDTQSFSSSLRA